MIWWDQHDWMESVGYYGIKLLLNEIQEWFDLIEKLRKCFLDFFSVMMRYFDDPMRENFEHIWFFCIFRSIIYIFLLDVIWIMPISNRKNDDDDDNVELFKVVIVV